MKRIMVGMCLLLVLPLTAFAHGGIDTAKHALEATMLVTGDIAINPDGTVYGYSLDNRDKLPPEIVKLIDDTLSGWKFKPVQVAGKIVRAQTQMSLRIVANQDTPGHFVATVEGAAFGNDGDQPGIRSSYGDGAQEGLTYLTHTPPEYPLSMFEQRVSGTVYVVVEVNRSGRVEDAAVRQVNLRRLGDATELKRWRDAFAEATLAAIRKWTFNVPTSGTGAAAHQWFVSIPINYSLLAPGQKPPPYTWDAYVPGPVNPLPWQPSVSTDAAFSAAGDAIPDSSIPFVAAPRFVLLTSSDDAAPAPQPKAQPGSG